MCGAYDTLLLDDVVLYTVIVFFYVIVTHTLGRNGHRGRHTRISQFYSGGEY